MERKEGGEGRRWEGMEGRREAENLIHTSNISWEHPNPGIMLDARYYKKKEHCAFPNKPQGVFPLDEWKEHKPYLIRKLYI